MIDNRARFGFIHGRAQTKCILKPAGALASFAALAVFASLLLLTGGCSSAPKRPAEITAARNACDAQIAMGDAASARGDFANAELYFAEAWRLAVGADYEKGRIRALLSRGEARFAAGDIARAQTDRQQAYAEAAAGGYPALAAAAQASIARGNLGEGRADVSTEDRAARAIEAQTAAREALPLLGGEPLLKASVLRTAALAEKDLGNFAEAEKHLLEAAGIHEKGLFLEDSGYDWFLLASVRSKAGMYDRALEALDRAIEFDRKAEHSAGLGMDWLARGTVFEKKGERDAAAAAYRRSAEIFAAAYLKENERAARAALEKMSQ